MIVFLPFRFGISISFRISRITSIKISSWSLTRLSSSASFWDSFTLVRAISRSRMNARTIKTLILFARSECNTLAACKAPYSVKANGSVRRPPQPEFDVANCDFKFSHSSRVSWNMKISIADLPCQKGKRVYRQTTIFPQQSVNCLWISGGLRSNWCNCDWRFSSLLKSWPVRIGNKNAGLERSGGVLIGNGDWLSFLYPRYPQWWGSVPYLVPWLRYDMNCFFIVHFKKKIFQMSKILSCVFTLYFMCCEVNCIKQ